MYSKLIILAAVGFKLLECGMIWFLCVTDRKISSVHIFCISDKLAIQHKISRLVLRCVCEFVMVSVCSTHMPKQEATTIYFMLFAMIASTYNFFWLLKKIMCVGHGYDMRVFFFDATHHTPGAGVGYYIWPTKIKMETMALSVSFTLDMI